VQDASVLLPNGFFNLGTERGHPVREGIDLFRHKARRNFKVVERERREGNPPVLISGSKKAKEALGWPSQYNNLEAIGETAWHWTPKEREDQLTWPNHSFYQGRRTEKKK